MAAGPGCGCGHQEMKETVRPAGERLEEMLKEAGLEPLGFSVLERFEKYLALLLRWNAKINLTAVRDADGILSRHFVESIACARALPEGIQTLLDFGSGAGFPGIPIALCRPEIAVTLAESQLKKAAFLHEAVRVLEIAAKVHAGRAEALPETFDCVVLRAVDRMPQAIQAAARMVGPHGWLALMTTAGDVSELEEAAGTGFSWSQLRLPGGEDRLLVVGKRGSLQA
jgi:16S rRNA (guanine527-N7)-methyltransferase